MRISALFFRKKDTYISEQSFKTFIIRGNKKKKKKRNKRYEKKEKGDEFNRCSVSP